MSREKVLSIIRDILCNSVHLVDSPEEIRENTDLIKEFSIDSMQLTTLLVNLEDELDIDIVSGGLTTEIATNLELLIPYVLKEYEAQK